MFSVNLSFLTWSRHFVVERNTLAWHVFVLLIKPKDSAGFLELLLNACFQPFIIFHKVFCLRCVLDVSASCICLWNLPARKVDYYFVSSMFVVKISIVKIKDKFFKNLLTLPALMLDQEKNNNLNFYFRTSLWCLKKFYEGLKGFHKTFWGTTKKHHKEVWK